MTEFLGETQYDWKELNEFKEYEPKDWALLYIQKYGGYDGGWHKDWVLDQVARILNGAEITVKLAQWDNGESEYRFEVGSSNDYIEWVKEYKSGEDGPETYDYSEGVAP